MEKFMCVSQNQRMLNFNGPSGITYYSFANKYFDVHNKDDIDFFNKNKRFEKKSFLETLNITEKPKSEYKEHDVDLKEYLESLGLSKSSINKVMHVYNTKKQLLDDGEQGFKFENILPKAQAMKLYNALFLNE